MLNNKIRDKFKWNMKLSLSIIPTVIVMIIVFFCLDSNSIVKLSEKNLKLSSDNCADKLDSWMSEIIAELNIYKDTIETNYSDNDDKLLKYLKTTYEDYHEAYPMGLYVGDDKGTYLDASGWMPGDGWVLTQRPWYVTGRDSYNFIFGEPYRDAQLDKMCISVSARLLYPDAVRVLAADIYLDYADELISDIVTDSRIDGAMFVSGANKIVLAYSEDTSVTGHSLNDINTSLSSKIEVMLENDVMGQKIVKAGGKKYYVNINKMDTTGWYLISYVRKTTILRDLYRNQIIMFIAALPFAILLIFITHRYALQLNEMCRKSKTDRLTKILNREGFEEKVNIELNERQGQGIMLILDMDNFKAVNDKLGHPEGDKVLIEFAQMLEDFFNRNRDFVSRIGGDEFAVFIGRNMSNDEVNIMLTKFMDKMRKNFEDEYRDFHLTCSIGGTFVTAQEKYSRLYRYADKNLYEVKRNGKNMFSIS
jgi:diguanylate cyclase (GGDEF)-like protein